MSRDQLLCGSSLVPSHLYRNHRRRFRAEALISVLFNLFPPFGFFTVFLILGSTFKESGIRRDKQNLIEGHWLFLREITGAEVPPALNTAWLLPASTFALKRRELVNNFLKLTYCGLLRYCFILFCTPVVIHLLLPPTKDDG